VEEIMGEPKKFIKVEICSNSKEFEYVGRCLGLVTPEEYAGIVDKSDLRNKISTVGTTSLKDIGSLDEVKGLRLVMTIKSKGDVNINKKSLFVSEPLEHISQFKANDEVTLVGESGTFMFVTEED
jgi:hypothetical protein